MKTVRIWRVEFGDNCWFARTVIAKDAQSAMREAIKKAKKMSQNYSKYATFGKITKVALLAEAEK